MYGAKLLLTCILQHIIEKDSWPLCRCVLFGLVKDIMSQAGDAFSTQHNAKIDYPSVSCVASSILALLHHNNWAFIFTLNVV